MLWCGLIVNSVDLVFLLVCLFGCLACMILGVGISGVGVVGRSVVIKVAVCGVCVGE